MDDNTTVQLKRYRHTRINGKDTYIHRYIMEQYLGRELGPDECVHHINGDKYDNRIENLELIYRSEHSRKHSIIYCSNAKEYNIGPARPVICIETGELFCSVSAAARAYGIHIGNLCSVCRGKLHTCGGYHWKYAED